jgi:hypothetical protein
MLRIFLATQTVRTGSRCTTLTKLPLAFSRGRKLNTVPAVVETSVSAHDRAAGVIGISGGEAGNCCRLEDIAGTLTVLDRTINRRVRRIIVQSYS